MKWYASRSVFLFGKKKSGANIFEERIVCFSALDFDEADKKAAEESITYADESGFSVHNEQMTFEQEGHELIDGYELWSELFESHLSLNEFYQKRYQQFLYDRATASKHVKYQRTTTLTV